jgi:hypothetical protein
MKAKKVSNSKMKGMGEMKTMSKSMDKKKKQTKTKKY